MLKVVYNKLQEDEGEKTLKNLMKKAVVLKVIKEIRLQRIEHAIKTMRFGLVKGRML